MGEELWSFWQALFGYELSNSQDLIIEVDWCAMAASSDFKIKKNQFKKLIHNVESHKKDDLLVLISSRYHRIFVQSAYHFGLSEFQKCNY